MKKSIALILAVLMTLSLAACGGGGGSSDKGGALPGIDMKSTDTQTVTSDRATLEVLNETFFTYLGGLNYFTEGDAQSKLTYAELKEHIGPSTSTRRSTSAVYTPGTPKRMTRAHWPFSSVTTAS